MVGPVMQLQTGELNVFRQNLLCLYTPFRRLKCGAHLRLGVVGLEAGAAGGVVVDCPVGADADALVRILAVQEGQAAAAAVQIQRLHPL